MEIKPRETIRFSNEEARDLDYWISISKVKNKSEAVHLAISYAIKYFKNVLKGLETDKFEVGIIRKTKDYKLKDQKDFIKI